MWTTIACLAAAMTGTAALLGWLDPSSRLTLAFPDGQDLEDVARQAQQVVADAVAVEPARWTDIEVRATGSSTAAGRMLMATADASPAHFVIDRAGRLTRSSRWREQRLADGDRGTVVVQVVVPRNGDLIAPTQWLVVRELVAAVNDSVRASSDPLPVRLPTDHAHIPWGARWTGGDPAARLTALAD